MKLVIVKYNAGNIQSVLYSLERIGVQATVTDDIEEITSADKVIFPGVGEASTAMRYLRQRKLDEVITSLTQPVLGVCLGMQLMCTHSTENDTKCLGIFDEQVKKFSYQTYSGNYPNDENLAVEMPVATKFKIPQIGWNRIYDVKSELLEGVNNGYCYFVHSYFASLGKHTIATVDYIQPYSAALHKNNFYGVQFHPEKSAATGQKILENFITRV